MEILDSVRRLIAGSILFNHKVAEQVGLGPSDGQFMTLLELHGPLTPGQLAEHSGLTTGTVTGVIDRLEKIGFVRRERAPDDRRKVIVSRNEEAIAEKMTPLYNQAGANLFALMGRYDQEQLTLIAGFLRQLAESNPEP